MENINITETISANLQEIRKEKQMTLQELADMTGVSKSMLGEIERGAGNPTITVLWKISTGLRIPISQLINARKPDYHLVHQPDWQEIGEQGCNTSMIFQFDHTRNFEVYHLAYEPHAVHESHSHQKGVTEYTMVYEGVFTIVVDGKPFELKKGDSFIFDAETPHSYRNDGDVVTKAYSLIYYPHQ